MPTPTFWTLAGVAVLIVFSAFGLTLIMAGIATVTRTDDDGGEKSPAFSSTVTETVDGSGTATTVTETSRHGDGEACPECGSMKSASANVCLGCEAEWACEQCNMPLDTEPDPDADRQLCTWCRGLEA